MAERSSSRRRSSWRWPNEALRLIGAALLCAAPAFAALNPQQPVNQHVLDVWGIEQGLPLGSVNAIASSNDGFLWMGTYEGLVRFDGSSMQPLDPAQSREVGTAISDLWPARLGGLWVASGDRGLSRLQGHQVVRWGSQEGLPGAAQVVREGEDGTVWVGTNAGLRRLVDGKLQPVPGVPETGIQSLTIDSSNRVWIGTRDRGLYRYDGLQTVPIRLGSDNAAVLNLTPARGGGVWAGTRDGLLRIHNRGIDRFSTRNGMAADYVSALCTDRNGNLWIGYQGLGLQRFDGQNFETLDDSEQRSNGFIRVLRLDHAGQLWIGTNYGAARLRESLFLRYGRREGLNHDFVRVLTEDRQHNVWAGVDGGGLTRIGADGVVTQLGAKDGLISSTVRALAVDAQDGVWISAFAQGLQHKQGDSIRSWTAADGLPSALIRAIAVDADGSVWIGSEDDGLARFRNGQFERYPALGEAGGIRALLPGRDGRLWVGTYANGLYVVEAGAARPVEVVPALPSVRILSLHEDSQGTLWIGTQGGLARYQQGRILDLSRAGGAFARAVFFISTDDDGALWFTSSAGVTQVAASALANLQGLSPAGLPHRTLGTEDGLPSPQINGASQPAGLRAHDGRLWIPTARGIAVLDPKNSERLRSRPRVQVEALLVQGNPVELPESAELSLPPGSDRIEIRYSGVDELMPGTPRFESRLRGLDEHWSEPEERRSLVYAALPPAAYQFEVRAVSRQGNRSQETATLRFRVEPAWYQRPVVRLGGTASFVLLVASAITLRHRRLKRINRWLKQEVAARTAEINEKNLALQTALAEVQRISTTDALTGLHNRRFLEASIDSDAAQGHRHYRATAQLPESQRERLLFAMIDLDHFKAVNDQHGHAAGDQVLRKVAEVLRQAVRKSDLVVRWGGEEFLLLIRFTSIEQACQLAERIVRAVATEPIALEGHRLHASCSIGIAAFPFLDAAPNALDWSDAVNIADVAVYLAKRRGRNRWVLLEAAPETRDGSVCKRLMHDAERTLAGGAVRLREGVGV